MNYRATPILFLLLLPVVFLSHGANALAAGTTAHSSAKVDTISGGDIDINTHWPLDVYYVIGDVTVSAGATLTIAPGAVVKFEWGHNMNVQGGLVADNAVFTSWQDDTYGGDNNDDGASTGEPGDWDGIIYNTSSSGGSLTNCLVRYAGCSTIGGIHVRCTAPVDLINVTAEYTGSLGPAFYLSHIGTISGCVARYNEGYGYQMVADLIDTFSHNSNTQSSNGYANIVRVCSNTLTGSATWSGSYDYLCQNDMTISAEATLTIAPGSVVKFESGHVMNVLGGLVADDVVFTSRRDDAYGGDSNGDGASTGEPGDWDGIIYNTSSTGGSLSNCLVRSAGGSSSGGIYVRCTAPVDLINVTAEYTGLLGPGFNLIHIGTISGCIARYNEGYGYQVVADLIDTFSHNSNTQSSNGYANIVRVCSNTLTGSATWSGSYDYLCQNDMTISAEATLMIASGSVVKFEPGHYLNVLGGLVADDVVFTSRRDDAYGGDSNGDGASTGEPGDWDGIIYNTSSTGGSLTDCLVRYAGGSSGGIYVRCTAPVDLINVTAEYTGLLGPGFNLSHIGTISGCIARYNEGYGYQVVADLIDAFSHNSNTQSSNGYANIVHVRSNTLTGSATWSGSYDYLCHGDMTISAGATLTIASGSVVKFEPGNYMNVLGGLVADDVVFTSRRDDAYGGDSNGDGASTGEPRDWNGIRYNTSSTGGSLANCHVRYAGDSGNGGIYVNCTAPVDLINVTAESTGSLGPAFTLASPGTLTGCVCRDNLGDGIRITSTDTHISTTDIYNDTGIGLEYTPADTLTAENCYWGHATGPQHPDNPGGLGTVVTGNVDFIPWSTLPNTLVLDSVLHGIVTDLTTGLPVDGAQVTLSPLYTGSSTVTGETGSWSLDVPAGAGYELVVAAEGYDDHTTSDLGFEPGQTYPLDVELTQTVAVEDAPPPRVLVLEQNRPNPFNPSTTIRFGLPAAGHVALKVYDARGHLVTVLVDGVRPAGRHEEVWSGDDDQGRRVPSGVYTYLLETAGAKKVRTMAVVQ